MSTPDRSSEPTNPLGMSGIEFIEFATAQPQAFGALLQRMSFHPIARHRSREVMLYRQGPMNLIVNADREAQAAHGGLPNVASISAVALCIADAAFAWRRALALGAWVIPTRASAMELNIRGVHGVGDSLIYSVHRHEELSIYDIDFVTLPAVDARPPSIAHLHYFGVVQSVGDARP